MLFTVRLEAALRERLDAKAADWFEDSLGVARREGATSEEFRRRWSSAGRRLGRSAVAWDTPAGATVAADEAGRMLLLLAGVEQEAPGEQESLVETLFHKGEERERRAVLRALPLLPVPERFVAVAAEGVRSNMLSVVEAIACENPYPSAHMPEPLFNQMIMKMLFNGFSVERVIGLEERRNDDLVRMVSSWIAERIAAGRPIPSDTSVILGRRA